MKVLPQENDFHRLIPPRPVDHNPRNPFCKLHLQRICGTCEHFGGDLRGVVDRAPCAALFFTTQRHGNAKSCRRWTRKNDQGGAQ